MLNNNLNLRAKTTRMLTYLHRVFLLHSQKNVNKSVHFGNLTTSGHQQAKLLLERSLVFKEVL